ncbi:Rieske (2Fe-2S) protein [Streptomyces ziwulingensis]|uniref:Cytochrome bc1 complex Rieske iron-sulfur subunit n=1 Tax=Streptomyces ziwulingensis TaxID=1045501 RepID=A0ABP9AKW7_9ACTN
MTQSAKRRTVLLATGATALAAGCGDGDDSGDGGDSTAASSAATGGVLASVGDIPVGGGKVFKEQKVVVTQPEKGDLKAFSAVCTHQGCVVADVAGGTINCACHGSKFNLTDGSAERGPATKPLPAEQITVEGNSVRLT